MGRHKMVEERPSSSLVLRLQNILITSHTKTLARIMVLHGGQIQAVLEFNATNIPQFDFFSPRRFDEMT